MRPEPRPATVGEWAAYFEALPGARLWQKARAINSPEFVELLQRDGLCAAEIEAVFAALAGCFRRLRLRPPPGSYVDLLAPPFVG